MRPAIWPDATSNDTPSNATMPPKRTDTARTLNRASALLSAVARNAACATMTDATLPPNSSSPYHRCCWWAATAAACPIVGPPPYGMGRRRSRGFSRGLNVRWADGLAGGAPRRAADLGQRDNSSSSPKLGSELGSELASRVAGSRPGGTMPPPARAQLAAPLHLLLAQPPARECEPVPPSHFAAPMVPRRQLRGPLDVALRIGLHRRTTKGAGRRRIKDGQGADQADPRNDVTVQAREWHDISPLDVAGLSRHPVTTLAPRRQSDAAARARRRSPAPSPPAPRQPIRHALSLATAWAQRARAILPKLAPFCPWLPGRSRLSGGGRRFDLQAAPPGASEGTLRGDLQRRSPAARRRSIICE